MNTRFKIPLEDEILDLFDRAMEKSELDFTHAGMSLFTILARWIEQLPAQDQVNIWRFIQYKMETGRQVAMGVEAGRLMAVAGESDAEDGAELP